MRSEDVALASDLLIAVRILGAARLLYPEVKTVVPVSGSIYEHVLDGTLRLVSVKLPRQV